MKDINDKLSMMVDKESQKSNTHSVLLAVRSGDGKVDFKGAAGEANTESPYFIASITKMFTASVIMQLVEEKLINLEDSFSQYLPSLQLDGINVYKGYDFSREIKVSHLISHTSGLPDYYEGGMIDDIKNNRDLEYDINDVLKMVRGMKSYNKPGSGRAYYSDTNYQLLGLIIESVTESTLEDVFAQRIFEPLQLDQTFVFDYRKEQSVTLSMYRRNLELNLPKALSCMSADGGIASTLADSLKFLRAYFGGKLFPSWYMDQMQQWNPMFFPMEYGYGLWRYRIPKWMNPFMESPELIGHAGSSGSFAFYEPGMDIYLSGTFNQIDNPARPFRFMTKVISEVNAATKR